MIWKHFFSEDIYYIEKPRNILALCNGEDVVFQNLIANALAVIITL